MRKLFNIFAISAIMVCFSCGQATNKQKEQQEQDVFAEFNKQLEQKKQQEQQEADDQKKPLYGYWKDSNGIIELFLNADEMFCVVDKELIYRGGWRVNRTGGAEADDADAFNGGLEFTAINEGTYTSLTPIWINIKLRKDSSKKKISWSRSSNRTLNDAIDIYNGKVTWLNGQWAFGYRWEDIYGNIFMDWCVLWIELETNNIEVHYYPGRTAGHKSKYVYNGTFTIDEYSNNIKFIIDEPFKSVNSWENEIMGYKEGRRRPGTMSIILEKSMNFKFDPDRRVIYNYIQGGNRPFEKCGPGWRIGG